MSQPSYERVVKPERRAIMTTYEGPRSGVGEGVLPLAAWVSRYDRSRIDDITVAFAERPPHPEPPTASVIADIFVEVDDAFEETTELPPDLDLVRLPAQTVLKDTYVGPISGLVSVIHAWLSAMQDRHKLRPGYLQRIVRQGRTPEDSGWEVEMAVVLKG